MGVFLWSRGSYEDLSKSEISVVLYRQNGWVMVVTVSRGGGEGRVGDDAGEE